MMIESNKFRGLAHAKLVTSLEKMIVVARARLATAITEGGPPRETPQEANHRAAAREYASHMLEEAARSLASARQHRAMGKGSDEYLLAGIGNAAVAYYYTWANSRYIHSFTAEQWMNERLAEIRAAV